MKARYIVAAALTAALALPLAAEAQGIVRGAQQGAAVGNRAAGPVGGAVGGVVGGVTGGVVGGVRGVVGVPQSTGFDPQGLPQAPPPRPPLRRLALRRCAALALRRLLRGFAHLIRTLLGAGLEYLGSGLLLALRRRRCRRRVAARFVCLPGGLPAPRTGGALQRAQRLRLLALGAAVLGHCPLRSDGVGRQP